MSEKGLWKGTVMRFQVLPESFVVAAVSPQQEWCLLLPVRPALAADGRRETLRQDFNAVHIMVQPIYDSTFLLSSQHSRSRWGLLLGPFGALDPEAFLQPASAAA